MRAPNPKAIVERGNHLHIYVRNDFRRIGRGFTLGGLYVGVPFAILGIVGFNLPRDWVLLGVVGAVLGVVGGVFALVGVFFWLLNNGTVDRAGRGAVRDHRQAVARRPRRLPADLSRRSVPRRRATVAGGQPAGWRTPATRTP